MEGEKATFGAGCFWGIEHSFSNLKGVLSTSVGYSGGKTNNPSYEEVCTGTTDHAEVVHLEFNPEVVSYKELLGLFWDIHDPTTINRQGPDIGSQYRSCIFYHSENQKDIALKSKEELSKTSTYKDQIVTEITPFEKFFKAEEYHQNYFKKLGIAPSCHR